MELERVYYMQKTMVIDFYFNQNKTYVDVVINKAMSVPISIQESFVNYFISSSQDNQCIMAQNISEYACELIDVLFNENTTKIKMHVS
jgi:hypothetical protein